MSQPSASRSANMRAIRSKDTKPEMRVRRIAHSMGLRFRLHRSDLPGSPDLVFPRHRLALFVHGCFWHGHGCKRGGKGPKSNTGYWLPKIERTQARDVAAETALKEQGWRVAVMWECELTRDETIRSLIARAMNELPK
ncbi:very short patch repair endonuclease [Sphingomonas sp.]|uniref:very short patch repair endonuclease n=1 Tax=Sphingomonas sp. TaxID=28214 RepID=UPI0038B1EBDF